MLRSRSEKEGRMLNVGRFPLNDQEILLRHLHKATSAYVAGYQAQREPPHAAGHTSVAAAAG
jgi:hypothetical protein